nr:ABC-2 family transporter protein [Paenibacillus larvae]
MQFFVYLSEDFIHFRRSFNSIRFFPSWLKVTANLLPFGLIIYAPAKLFVNFSWAGFWEVAGFQVLWSLVFVILLTIVYRNGIRKVTLNGG